ncbi:MAG: hypothetical protein KTR32_40145 [Granulosicoccus sp.]|nr:hypothetical protein [Granulosicoccus sp.]
MTVILLKYGLPALLGYILFIGISGQFNPFRRPVTQTARPSWFFGLWTGLTVAAVFTLGLHMAYSMSLESARSLVTPSAMILGVTLITGFTLSILYRRSISDSPLDTATTVDAIAHEPAFDEALDNASDIVALDDLDKTLALSELPSDCDETIAEATDLMDEDIHSESLLELNAHPENAHSESMTVEDSTALTSEATQDLTDQSTSEILAEPVAEESIEVTAESIPDANLTGALDQEIQLRQQTEKHLRITRKALAVLESESRSYEMSKADALTHLESELEERIRQTAKAEARGNREAAKRQSLESDMLNAKQELAEAKKALRKNTAARAKALSTADRAVTFARQSINARSIAEKRVKELEESLKNRQATISSLIQSLEKEKGRTQIELQSMAKQMLMEEKQLRARRRLDEAARRVEGKFTNRLVKKVARSRPVASD